MILHFSNPDFAARQAIRDCRTCLIRTLLLEFSRFENGCAIYLTKLHLSRFDTCGAISEIVDFVMSLIRQLLRDFRNGRFCKFSIRQLLRAFRYSRFCSFLDSTSDRRFSTSLDSRQHIFNL